MSTWISPGGPSIAAVDTRRTRRRVHGAARMSNPLCGTASHGSPRKRVPWNHSTGSFVWGFNEAHGPADPPAAASGQRNAATADSSSCCGITCRRCIVRRFAGPAPSIAPRIWCRSCWSGCIHGSPSCAPLDKLRPWALRVMYRMFVDQVRRDRSSPVQFRAESRPGHELATRKATRSSTRGRPRRTC